MSRPRFLAVAVLAALALGACGSNSGDEKDVKQTVAGFYKALADKDSKKACDSISAAGQASITNALRRSGTKEQTCAQAFGLILSYGGSAIQQAKNVKVSNVKVKGDKASAKVSLAGRSSPVGLVKEHGDWKLSGLNLGGQ